ncbi:TlpA disulfide reductase family protein [Pedobacter sp. UYP30]|uniref:TlpA family protein disulfide reductase n=1 Tax=Pedobacter sp. UYP30 TaxID=1756400 RepID=UPI003395C0E5
MGDQAPKIMVTNWLKNIPVSKDLSGKFIVIDFWATWCSPCLESVPHMNDLVEKNKQKTNLIFLAMTDERADKVKRLLLRLPFSSSVVADTTRKTSDNFKIESIPYCVVIDDQNIVRWLGNPTELTSADIEEILERKTITAPVAEKTTTALDSVTSKIYKKLFENYYASFNDKSLKEYFAMGPVIRQKHGSSFSSGPSANNAFDDVAIGCALISRLADYLDVAEKQLILPDSLTEMYISYCYKSKKKNTKK